jgi:MoxR-like ATPase
MSARNIPSVVLIDEIDKADIDFPNDLLLLLDRFQFKVEEIDEPYTVDALRGENEDHRRQFLPIVIITSNREKALPMPFLRRCLYYHIKFPNLETLKKIVKEHCKELTPLFKEAVKIFWGLRDAIKWHKPPGTSELLDWIRILEKRKFKTKDLISSPIDNLPHIETLVKVNSDLKSLRSIKK